MSVRGHRLRILRALLAEPSTHPTMVQLCGAISSPRGAVEAGIAELISCGWVDSQPQVNGWRPRYQLTRTGRVQALLEVAAAEQEERPRRELGQLLLGLRLGTSFTQDALANKLGLTHASVGRIERGASLVRRPILKAWLDATAADGDSRSHATRLWTQSWDAVAAPPSNADSVLLTVVLDRDTLAALARATDTTGRSLDDCLRAAAALYTSRASNPVALERACADTVPAAGS